MRKATLGLIGTIALMMSGCLVLSIHPLYTFNDVVSVPEAAGTWSNPQDGGRWTFTPEDNFSFTVVTDGEEVDSEFEGWFVRLNHELFLDLYPNDASGIDDFLAAHLVPAHSFWRVTFAGQTMTLEYMDIEKFNHGFSGGKFDIAHLDHNDMAVITAPTTDVQDFIKMHFDELVSEDAFVLTKEK